MNRKSAWPEILADEIRAAEGRPFLYGKFDCCLFAADVVLAMTGTDIAADYRGQYSDADGAKAALKKFGRGTLTRSVISIMAAHGARQIKPAMARRGDLVMAPVATPEGVVPAVGICVGREALFASDGLSRVAMSEVKRAWRCG